MPANPGVNPSLMITALAERAMSLWPNQGDAIVATVIDTNAAGVPDQIRADHLDCYDGDRYVESMRYVRRYPDELPALARLLPQITTPVTLINGRHDRVVPLANVEFLDARLPHSRMAIIDAGHFVWEEAPAEYASIILDSIAGSSRWDGLG